MVEVKPLTGNEKDVLHDSLRRHRDAVRWKVEGVDDEALRRPMTPSGTNLIGLVKHLASVESLWFCDAFGRPGETLPFDEADPDADMRAAPGERTEDILAYYARTCAAADRTIAELDLDQLGRSWRGVEVNLRWVLVHMVEETARHAGHLDILRELADGATGSRRPS
ncbi:DinB family protein [Dactylosporangium sp. NPDC005572]|uniref:DinB family protein n=1 Tax=Dactylosporangium sp. NPDC005572 TaxID=3156889 RepID=UPI0033BEAFE8